MKLININGEFIIVDDSHLATALSETEVVCAMTTVQTQMLKEMTIVIKTAEEATS